MVRRGRVSSVTPLRRRRASSASFAKPTAASSECSLLQVETPPPGLSVYRGIVRHSRSFPAVHSFGYTVALVLVDVSSPAVLAKALTPLAPLSAVGLASFDEASHMRARSHGTSLGEAVRTAVRGSGVTSAIAADLGRVLLLTHLTYMGYCFNPVSFYYVFSASNPCTLRALVLEVHNTPWTEQHVYVLAPGAHGVRALQLPMAADAATVRPTWEEEAGGWGPLAADAALTPPHAPWLRFLWHKAFHVSPFMPMDQVYDWIFSPPGGQLRVFSRNLQLNSGVGGGSGSVCPVLNARGTPPPPLPPRSDSGPSILTTSVSLTRDSGPVTTWVLLWLAIFAFPLLTQRVQAWIHVEAYRLWQKGVQLHPHPTGATNAFTRTVGAIAEGVVLPLTAACRRQRT